MSEIQVGGGGGTAILYHVRIRGKIYGPYPIQKLQDLAKKSVVSRINQVSVDGGNSWQPASEFTEIFEAAAVQVVIPVQQAGVGQVGVAAQGPAGPLQATSAEIPWYYLINGQKHGPTTLSQLQMMVSTGTLNSADYACQEGAADWSRVDMVPELMSIIRGSGGGGGGTKKEGAELSGRVKKAFKASRPWTMMMAILAFISAGVLLLFGILLFFSGPSDDGVMGMMSIESFGQLANDELGTTIILIAVGAIFAALASTLGGVMLLLHSGKIPVFVREATEKRLAPVGESLSHVWLVQAIVATVCLVSFTVFVILIMTKTLVVIFVWP